MRLFFSGRQNKTFHGEVTRASSEGKKKVQALCFVVSYVTQRNERFLENILWAKYLSFCWIEGFGPVSMGLRGPGNPCAGCSVMSDSVTPWTIASQASLSIGFPRQESWSGLPFTPPGDLPNPGIEIMSPAMAGGFFTTWEALGFLAVICRRTNVCAFHLWAKQAFAFTSCLKGFGTPKRLRSPFWDSGGWLHWNRDTGGKKERTFQFTQVV